ncbi:MAG: triphosphoribosyl-dephospho-CoA synthetase [Phycisphaeraceae bacterium]|nr:triphosphoribosyl-dephospho-CoA synthetase [Phycisphaeraceae bacterium]
MPPIDATCGQLAQWACLLEVTAPKAGNVHPGASFDDMTWDDFAVSAAVIRPVLDRAEHDGVGATVLGCVEATRQAVGVNTNLGVVLLLAPMCAVPGDRTLGAGLPQVLSAMKARDAELVYDAIRQAAPGGLGRVAAADVDSAPPDDLLDAMRQAADRDAVARQYAEGFAGVLEAGHRGFAAPVDQSIVRAHLSFMAAAPDSLIRRKCGDDDARMSQTMARAVLNSGWPDTEVGLDRFARLDAWLRQDGHRRNPGTSADLVAAALFVALRAGVLEPPFAWDREVVDAP